MTDEGKTAPTGYWWCPTCKEEVGGYHVTNQEKHESCGHPVIWVEPVDAELCPKGTMAALRKMTNWASCLDEELMGERQVVESVADIATAESILQQAKDMQ